MNQHKVMVRHAKENDLNRILELLIELGRPMAKNEYETRKFKSLVKDYVNSRNNERSILVTGFGTAIIGLVSYILLDRLGQELREFWIPDLIVSKEYRNRGVGKLLIQRCEFICEG